MTKPLSAFASSCILLLFIVLNFLPYDSIPRVVPGSLVQDDVPTTISAVCPGINLDDDQYNKLYPGCRQALFPAKGFPVRFNTLNQGTFVPLLAIADAGVGILAAFGMFILFRRFK